MDKELIERLAREAGILFPGMLTSGPTPACVVPVENIPKFAALIAEECAKAAEGCASVRGPGRGGPCFGPWWTGYFDDGKRIDLACDAFIAGAQAGTAAIREKFCQPVPPVSTPPSSAAA